MTNPAAVLEHIAASFDPNMRAEFTTPADALRLILDEEGPEALIQAITDAHTALRHPA